MKLQEDKEHSNKIDVIIHGIETIGSAERSTSKDEMRKSLRLFQMVDMLIFYLLSLERHV